MNSLSSHQPLYNSLSKTPAAKENWGVRARVGFLNDSGFSSGIAKKVLPEHQMEPDGLHTDDDGFTHGTNLSLTFTKGNEQVVLSAQSQMLTEERYAPGGRNPDFQGRRIDFSSVNLEKNMTENLSANTSLTRGFGAGLQVIGRHGGDKVQDWFHATAPMGGRRLGEGSNPLQSQYTTNSNAFIPQVTGGAKIKHNLVGQLEGTGIDAYASAKAHLPLGNGIATGNVSAGLEARISNNVKVYGGVDVGGFYSANQNLDFMNRNGVRTGMHLGAELQLNNGIGLDMKMVSGGARGEMNWGVGVTIPLSSGSKSESNRLLDRPFH